MALLVLKLKTVGRKLALNEYRRTSLLFDSSKRQSYVSDLQFYQGSPFLTHYEKYRTPGTRWSNVQLT